MKHIENCLDDTFNYNEMIFKSYQGIYPCNINGKESLYIYDEENETKVKYCNNPLPGVGGYECSSIRFEYFGKIQAMDKEKLKLENINIILEKNKIKYPYVRY